MVSVGQEFSSDCAGWFWGLPGGVPSSAGAEVLQVQRTLPRVPRRQRPPFPLGTLCPHSMALAPAGAPTCWGSWANTAVSCDHHFCPSVSQRGVTGSGPQLRGEELATAVKGGVSEHLWNYFKATTWSGKVGRHLYDSEVGFASHT